MRNTGKKFSSDTFGKSERDEGCHGSIDRLQEKDTPRDNSLIDESEDKQIKVIIKVN